MEEFWFMLRLLLLLGVANSAPIAAKLLFGQRWSLPVDAGMLFFDGRPVLGPSKTWRGLISAVLLTALVGFLMDIAPAIGAVMGAAAMVGDAMSSFVKRRLGIASSDRATGLDQIPEALLPLLVVYTRLALTPSEVASITLAFFLLEIPLAWLSFKLGLRERPY
jgi:CDP-2,3-bis-(O-geranylgeranyl)-sn-glycerol synthase